MPLRSRIRNDGSEGEGTGLAELFDHNNHIVLAQLYRRDRWAASLACALHALCAECDDQGVGSDLRGLAVPVEGGIISVADDGIDARASGGTLSGF